MIDSLLTEIAHAGWFLNNCYQVDATLWRVNLRKPAKDGDWFTDWAEATTFADALEECMSKLADAEFYQSQPLSFGAAPKPTPLTAISLLTSLGLRKPLNRRA